MMMVYCQSSTVLTPSDSGKWKYYQDTGNPVIINAAEIVDVELIGERHPDKIIIRTSNRQYTFYKTDEYNELGELTTRGIYTRLIKTLTELNAGILITAVPHPYMQESHPNDTVRIHCLWDTESSQKVTT